ncbi:MAG: hypothetical protein IPJ69_00240 [Deltaproteobacteria bacterium]|nr:MAG: hypothetical protein IPJ69_00240 [Deltaproteobacteria bacterium]
MALVIYCYLTACSKAGPASTETTSAVFSTLEEKISFLEKYVTFHRHYKALDYFIIFHNNSSFLAAPSDWQIAILAQVPSEELSQWVINENKIADPNLNQCWEHVPNSSQLNKITDWYIGNSGQFIGINRTISLVAYCNKSQ